MVQTITGGNGPVGTVTNAVFLSTLVQKKLFITSGALGAFGTVVGGAYGIGGDVSQVWTIDNQGTVSAPASYGIGISLSGAGTIINDGTASAISGFGGGVALGSGIVRNQGSILGLGGAGVAFSQGGTLVNTGAAAFLSGMNGVTAAGARATVANTGVIIGNLNGIKLTAGGIVRNLGSDALIEGHTPTGIDISGASGTVINSGGIQGATAVRLEQGGTLDNLAVGQIEGFDIGASLDNGGTLLNQGTLRAGAIGVTLGNGGSVVQEGLASFLSGGAYGILASGVPASVENDGTIKQVRSIHTTGGGGSAAIGLGAGGTVTNVGTGSLINFSDLGIIASGFAMVVNQGSIIQAGTSGGGVPLAVELSAGGTVLNAAGALISSQHAIAIAGTGTVINLGSIVAGVRAGFGVDRGLVVNAGRVSGFDGIGVANGSIQNSGIIDATHTGMSMLAGTITNTGTIKAPTGPNGTGIKILGDGSHGSLRANNSETSTPREFRP